jgi:hypothetical protein
MPLRCIRGHLQGQPAPGTENEATRLDDEKHMTINDKNGRARSYRSIISSVSFIG